MECGVCPLKGILHLPKMYFNTIYLELRSRLLKMQMYDVLQNYFFVLRLRTKYFHTEVRGYELLSAYDTIH